MSRQEGQLLQIGGHHAQMGRQQQMGGMPVPRQERQPLQTGGYHMMGGQQQMGGIPVQWPGGGIYYATLMAYLSSGYVYQPMMAQWQQPPQHEVPFVAHQAGGYNQNGHSAPPLEHQPHRG